jgi:hypothetical protein
VHRERHIPERAVGVVAEQAAKADDLVDEADAAGGGSHPVTIQAKTLRLELIKVKSDLERELATLSLDCRDCGLDVHYVAASVSRSDIGRTRGRRRTRNRGSKSERLREPRRSRSVALSEAGPRVGSRMTRFPPVVLAFVADRRAKLRWGCSI